MTEESHREIAERMSKAFRRLREAHQDANQEHPPVQQLPAGWCNPEDLNFLHAEAQAAREAYSEYLWSQNPGIIPLPSLEGDPDE